MKKDKFQKRLDFLRSKRRKKPLKMRKIKPIFRRIKSDVKKAFRENYKKSYEVDTVTLECQIDQYFKDINWRVDYET